MKNKLKCSLTVVKPGQLSLIQDFGRFGLSHLGITQGGPVDDYAYSWANYLLGNSVNQSAIEITLGQVAFRINHDCILALCGGDLNAKLDNQTINNWSTFRAHRGQTLSFGLPKNGLRAYLAIKGGFDVPVTLGSSSTVIRDGLGGFEGGTSLSADLDIPFTHHSIPEKFKPVFVTFRFKPNYNLPLKLRVIESYQCDSFSEESKSTIYSSEYIVDQNSNRMGYRLSGPKVNSPKAKLLSEGIALGSIQVPADGQPIILLNDRQTIGGYPKLGCVARIDLPRLAQAKPGQSVEFVKGDRLGLQDVWCQWANFFGY
ncbi:biotin-dependent carboxyltransferase family protein [Vibrio makurazakiensis]|uniref:5-oxoprolinase subunit C family protein n=1 Tax=Vibrio makurazakiensis TaxID=2910250 RepID=UPI003D0FC319